MHSTPENQSARPAGILMSPAMTAREARPAWPARWWHRLWRSGASARLRGGSASIGDFWSAAPDAFFLVDSSLRVVAVNAAGVTLAGTSAEGMIGRTFLALLVPGSTAGSELSQAVRSRQPQFLSDVGVRRPGNAPVRRVALKLFPVAGGAGIVAADMTEFSNFFEEAGHLSHFLQHAISSANVCLHVIDRQRNTLIWNHAAEALTGYTVDEVVGTDELWGWLFPCDNQRESMFARLEQVFEGNAARGLETVVTVKAGETRTLSWHWQRVLDDNGMACGCIGIGIDISSRRDLEQQLLMAQKMEAIGTLAGGVAHDFNNLLTVIFGNTELALGTLKPQDPATPLLDEVLTTAHRASSLTRQLLLFSRKQTGTRGLIRINDTINGMLKMLGRLLKEHITIRTELAEAAPPIMADEGHMEQILLNLCINARDAMPQGGTITVSTRKAVLTPKDCQRCAHARPGTFLVLNVRDSGTGISPEIVHRIFEPFFTTKPAGQGTGLGLAVVYGVVKQMEGWITVNSETGRGAEFEIFLPAHREAAVQRGAPGMSSTFRGTHTWRDNGKWILLVEDETALCKTLERALLDAGYMVWVAGRAADARAILQNCARPLAFVITDVILPDGNGLELVREFKLLEKDIRVVIITGYAENIPDMGQLSTQNVRLLQKPFSLDLLMQTLQDMCEPEVSRAVSIRDTTILVRS